MEQKEFDVELQMYIKNMLEISWDYIYNSKSIDAIYIYCSLGFNEYFDNLYKIENHYFEAHKIRLIDPDFTVTDERQEYLNEKSMTEIRNIEKLFIKHEREVPFEIKIIYSPQTLNLDIKFSYENPFPNATSAIGDGFRKWMKDLGIEL